MWAALAKMTFRQQIQAHEFFSLELFFTLNVLVLQFYLGTDRIQLEGLTSDHKQYIQILSFVVPGAASHMPTMHLQLRQDLATITRIVLSHK